jgi:hypothetical protein
MLQLRRLTTPTRRAIRRAARGCWTICRRGFWPVVELAGAVLLIVCVGLYEPRLAVGIAGAALLLTANFRGRG